MVRPVVSDMIGAKATQHVDHAVNSPGGFTGAIAQVGHGVKGAVQVTGPIDKE
jgi:hypothetical protein